MSTLQSQIANTISTQLTQQGIADSSGGSVYTAQNIQNAVANNFTTANLQNCFANLSQQQGINIAGNGNAVSAVTMSQTMTATLNCVGSLITNANTQLVGTTTSNNTLSNTDTNPLAVIGDIFSGLFSDLTAPIEIGIGIFIFVIVAIIIAMVVRSMGHGSPPPPPPYTPFAGLPAGDFRQWQPRRSYEQY
jgi:hypothetical protein